MAIEKNSVLKKSGRDLINSKMGEEIMAMDMESGDYLHFNEIGSLIWENIEEDNTIEKLVNKLLPLYDITEEKCCAEVESYVQKLIDMNLLEISS